MLQSPFAEWGLPHILNIIISLGLVAVSILRMIRVYRRSKAKKEETDETQEGSGAKEAEELPQPKAESITPEIITEEEAEKYLDEMTPEEARRFAAAKQADRERYGADDF